MKKIIPLFFLLLYPLVGFSSENRDLLKKEAERIGIDQVLIRDFSELNFPTYQDRDFWDELPTTIKGQYIQQAEQYLEYNWPVVKATDYLEIIRSGGRNQQAYAAPRAAITALVMGELIEGKGRFTDQIVNGAWYYSEQTWWGWSAHLKHQKAPHGLPDADEPLVDLGVGEITNILSWTWFLFKEEFDKIHPLIAKRLKDEIKKAPAQNALISDFWLPDTEVAGGRDQAGSSEGFFFAAKGGHNQENHNHNDVGSCVVYYNGKPCLIDLGRETYVAKTFSSERYDIWTMQSQYHNTPKINGQDQAPGAAFKAQNTTFQADAQQVVFSTDIAGAYPESANVNKWERKYLLARTKQFTIQDKYEFSKVGDGPTTLNLITYCKVSEIEPGKLLLAGEGFKLALTFDQKVVSPKIEFHEITDEGLKRYWPQGITRIVFEINKPKKKGMQSLVLAEM